MSRRGNRGAISDFGKACSSRREELRSLRRTEGDRTSVKRHDFDVLDPESVLVASDRLVFVSYDEQLYKDLKAHQDKRVAKMQRKK